MKEEYPSGGYPASESLQTVETRRDRLQPEIDFVNQLHKEVPTNEFDGAVADFLHDAKDKPPEVRVQAVEIGELAEITEPDSPGDRILLELGDYADTDQSSFYTATSEVAKTTDTNDMTALLERISAVEAEQQQLAQDWGLEDHEVPALPLRPKLAALQHESVPLPAEKENYSDLDQAAAEAIKRLTNSETTPEESVSIFDEIYALDDKMAAVMTGFANEKNSLPADEAAKMQDKWMSHLLGQCVQELTPDIIGKFLSLPVANRGKFESVRQAIIDEPNAHTKQLVSRLEGYTTLRKKWEHQQSGHIETNQPITRLDTYDDLDPNTSDDERSRWAHEYMVDYLGMSDYSAAELTVAMEGRVSRTPLDGQRSQYLDCIVPAKHRDELERVTAIVEAVGIETVRKLRAECGIVNIGELSVEQAERMNKFIDRDPNLLADLLEKEVCLVLSDATSDWNGAFHKLYTQYETTDAATLVFELAKGYNTEEDINRYKTMLEERGMQASVVVVAGHGLPGSLKMGDVNLLPTEPNITPDGSDRKIATLESSGIKDMMLNMKPDRDGNCTIIFESCSQDAPLRHDDDTVLTRTALELGSDDRHRSTTHIYGITAPSKMLINQSGVLYNHRGTDVRRVVVTESGKVYRHIGSSLESDTLRALDAPDDSFGYDGFGYIGRIELPMFKKVA